MVRMKGKERVASTKGTGEIGVAKNSSVVVTSGVSCFMACHVSCGSRRVVGGCVEIHASFGRPYVRVQAVPGGDGGTPAL